VHAGGRGKAGGVKLAKSSGEARAHGEAILGMRLVTPQTGKDGKLVRKVYVEAGCNIGREFYLSLLVDRAKKSIAIVASTEGGMEIEEVAERSPEKIITVLVDAATGLQAFQILELGLALKLSVDEMKKLAGIVNNLYTAFLEKDLSHLGTNRLVITKEGEFMLLDAKCAVDGNALFRHPDLKLFKDYDEMDRRDLRAGKYGLSY